MASGESWSLVAPQGRVKQDNAAKHRAVRQCNAAKHRAVRQCNVANTELQLGSAIIASYIDNEKIQFSVPITKRGYQYGRAL